MPSRFLLALSLVTAAFFCALAPAHAGQWAVSYTYTFTHDGQTTSATDVSAAPVFVGGGGGSLTLVVTATLFWAPDNPQDTSSPPAKVSYMEDGHAQIQAVDTLTPVNKGLANINTTASNGLEDDPVPFTPSPPQYGDTSDGAHLTQAQGAAAIVLPTRTLSANLTYDGANSDSATGGFALRYNVVLGNGNLEGHSTADTANWDPTHPRFFSGTACRALGTAVAITGNVSHAQLCIGENGSDTVVNEYFDQSASGGTSAASVPLNAMFDSTHFKDGAKIKITLKVWDTNGGYYEIQVEGPGYNKAYVLTNGAASGFKYGGFAAHRDIIDSYLDEANYDVTASSYHRKSAILARVPAATLLYVSSHANSQGFGDCYDSDGHGELVPYLASGNPPSASIQTSISMKTPAQPPYNFAMVDGCDSAGGFGLNGSFVQGGGANGFGFFEGLLSDQAFVGWGDEMLGSLDYVWSELVLDGLQAGRTLYDAIEEASAVSPPIGPFPGSGIQQGEQVLLLGKYLYISPIIVGDPFFKLHGVYLGNSQGGGYAPWFRPLR